MSHYGIFKNTVLHVKFCFSLMGDKVSFGQEFRGKTGWAILSSEKKMFKLINSFFSSMYFNKLVYSYFCLHVCVYLYSMCIFNMMSGVTLKPVP